MTASRLFDVIGGIIVVAMLTTIFARKESAAVITAIGTSLSGAISAALGKGVTF